MPMPNLPRWSGRLFLALALSASQARAQDCLLPYTDPYANWDGITHWTAYQILGPNYLGPNALPVPYSLWGRLPERAFYRQAVGAGWQEGDRSLDTKLRLGLPFAQGRVAFWLDYVAVEAFRMDSALSYRNRAFLLGGREGFAFGDLAFATGFALARGHARLPDLVLRLSCRTASGTDKEASRFIDSPGYAADLGMGRSATLPGGGTLRWHMAAGFYVWQTVCPHGQNDAFSHAGGLSFEGRRLSVSGELAGYMGYSDMGDSPLLWRAELAWQGRRAVWRASSSAGLHSWPHRQVELSASWDWGPNAGLRGLARLGRLGGFS